MEFLSITRVRTRNPALTALIAGLALLPSLARAADFTPLGDLPGGEFMSQAAAVSDDGSVVVGRGQSDNGREAFRWTRTGGMVALGDLPGTIFNSTSTDVSGSGAIVVGTGAGDFGFGAFRWTQAGGLTSLGDPPVASAGTSAAQMSGDGSVVVGFSIVVGSYLEAFRWTAADGITGLGYLPGDLQSSANAVSADGQVIVGSSQNGPRWEAFRWTADGGMVGLGFLPGGDEVSIASATSGDGSIVFGIADINGGGQAFRWTAARGMEPLGDVPAPGERVNLLESSSDGTVVVGYTANASGDEEAIVWTPDDGIQRLADVLVANGATIPAGWTLTMAGAVSLDGRWVAGTGLNPDGFEEAYLADLRPAGSSGGGSVDLLSLALLGGLFLWRGRAANAGVPA